MRSPGLRIAAIGFACLLLAVFVYWMNSDYSRISDKSYDYALALVSACSRQDEVRVKKIAQEVGESELPAYDRRVILNIAQQAQDGDWEAASKEARQLLKSQIQPARQL